MIGWVGMIPAAVSPSSEKRVCEGSLMAEERSYEVWVLGYGLRVVD